MGDASRLRGPRRPPSLGDLRGIRDYKKPRSVPFAALLRGNNMACWQGFHACDKSQITNHKSRTLPQRGPDAMHVIVVLERLKEFADFFELCIGKLGVVFRDVAELAGHDRPAV